MKKTEWQGERALYLSVTEEKKGETQLCLSLWFSLTHSHRASFASKREDSLSQTLSLTRTPKQESMAIWPQEGHPSLFLSLFLSQTKLESIASRNRRKERQRLVVLSLYLRNRDTHIDEGCPGHTQPLVLSCSLTHISLVRLTIHTDSLRSHIRSLT